MSDPVGNFHVIIAKDVKQLQSRVARFIAHRPEWTAEPRTPQHIACNNKGTFPYQVVRKIETGQQLRLV